MTDSNVVPLARPATFDEFWKAYPKRVGKPLAKAKWDAITNGGLRTRTLDKDSGQYVAIELKADAAELIEAAKRYRDTQMDKNTYRLKDDGRFTLHPASWLNQGRWEDA
jgi:hypothetical protein